MSEKISVVVLGTEDYLKKSLITLILGKEVSVHKHTQMKLATYENDTYEVIYTPNFYKASEEKIKKIFSSKHPDMSVLVVKDEISSEELWQQIEKTQKLTKEFRVLLPLNHKCEEPYPDNCCTQEELFSRLGELTAVRHGMVTGKRPADQLNTETETGGRSGTQLSTDPRKSSKGNHSDNKVNLVLLGLPGTGKSASGNTILGRRQFVSRVSSVPVTTECQEAETEINGTHVRVIDTPDIFDDEIKSSVKNQHVTKCEQLIQSGPCVFLLVMNVGRFTDGERDILEKLEKAFGSEAKEQTVILFTRGEELQRADMRLEEFLRSCQPELMNIVEQCDRRCVVFENEAPRQPQVTELMQTVNWMLDK